MKSNGDPLLLDAEVVRRGVGSSVSVAGGEGCWVGYVDGRGPGDSFDDFVKKLGIGNADGAGDAWKVAPAKAMLGFDVDMEAARCGVVCWALTVLSGEGGACLGLLLLFFVRDFELACEFGALLRAAEAFLMGV